MPGFAYDISDGCILSGTDRPSSSGPEKPAVTGMFPHGVQAPGVRYAPERTKRQAKCFSARVAEAEKSEATFFTKQTSHIADNVSELFGNTPSALRSKA